MYPRYPPTPSPSLPLYPYGYTLQDALLIRSKSSGKEWKERGGSIFVPLMNGEYKLEIEWKNGEKEDINVKVLYLPYNGIICIN